MRRATRGLEAQRDLVSDADAVAFKGDNFFRMIGEHADVFQAQVDQDLRADAALMLDHTLAGGLTIELTALVKMNLRQSAWFLGGINGETSSRVMQIEEHATVFLGDGFERERHELTAIAGHGAEDIAGQAVRMDAHERGRIAFEIAAH